MTQTMTNCLQFFFTHRCYSIKFVIAAVIYMSLTSVMTVSAQGPSQDGVPALIPWWQIVTGVLAIPTAILGLVYTYRLSQKTRLESQKLQLEILEKEGKGHPDTPSDIRHKHLASSPAAFAATIQDFVLRFILLYLAAFAWGLIQRIISPFLNASIQFWIIQEHINFNESWIAVLGVSLLQQVTGIGDLIIFLTLGWPLLSDISRAVGLPLLDIFRKHNDQK